MTYTKENWIPIEMHLNFVWKKGYAHTWDKKQINLITSNADQYKISLKSVQ